MVVRNPLILVSGCFSQLPYGDTVPGTDTVAQASGNAALVLGNTALASGNSALVVGSVAQASGSAALVVGTTALASGNAALSVAASASNLAVLSSALAQVALASGNAALVVGSNALASGAIAQASGDAALSTAGTALSSGNSALSLASTALASGNSALILGVGALPASGGVLRGDVANTASGYFGIPAGTTTERPSVPASGVVRYNATTSEFEGYTTDWSSFVTKSSTGDITVNSINSGPLAGFRNAIINGNFNVWQRGNTYTGGAGTSYHTADRWNLTGNNITSSILQFTPGQTDVPFEPQYYFRNEWLNTLSGSPQVAQRIEGVRTFAGQQVTLSFYAKTTSAFTLSSIALIQDFGSSGSADVSTSVASSVVIGTSWQKYTYTVTIPSIAGKTIAGGDDYLNLVFSPPNFTACTLDLAQVQLEAGPVATPFERRPIGAELALCQRYYLKIGAGGALALGQAYVSLVSGGLTYLRIHFGYNAVMRAGPTATFAAGDLVFSFGTSGSIVVQAVTGIAASFERFAAEFTINSSAAPSATLGLVGHLSLKAGTALRLDAEL